MHRYAAEAWGQVDELIDLLDEDGREWMRAQLTGYELWEASRLVDRNQAVAMPFLRATPAQQRKLLTKLRHDDDKRTALYCAIVWGTRAARLLDALSKRALTPGGAYRDTTRSAAEAVGDCSDTDEVLWPFGDESPFAPLKD